MLNIEVFMAMSQEQAAREGTRICMWPALPGLGRDVYFNMDKVPDELCLQKEIYGWMHRLCIDKKNMPDVMQILYPKEHEFVMTQIIVYKNDLVWDYHSMIKKIEGDKVWIIGFE